MKNQAIILTALFFSIFFLHDSFSITIGGGCSEYLSDIVNKGIHPVLREGGKEENARIEILKDRVTLETSGGRYIYRVDESGSPFPTVPHLGVTSRGEKRVDHTFHPDQVSPEALQDAIRLSVRADPKAHPTVRDPEAPPSKKSKLSLPQKRSVEKLIEMAPKTKEEARGYHAGLMLPPGVGKTTTSAHYIKALEKLNKEQKIWKKKTKVLFVVQNGLILNSAADTYQRELDLKNVARVHGQDSDVPITTEQDMIAITRSGYHNQLAHIHQIMTSDPDQPWVVIFDEAHHIGKDDGQFAEIRAAQERDFDERFSRLSLTATWWHKDADLVTDVLSGNVHAEFLTEEELEQLKQGINLPEITRKQLLRAMQAGYLKPIEHMEIVSDIVNQKAILKQEFSEELAGDIFDRILKQRQPNIADRGVLFFSSQKQADRYAADLKEKFGDDAEVRPYHTGKHVLPDTFDWINDRGSYGTKKEQKKHKYIFVVDKLNEGADIPGVNLIVLSRTYGNTQAGFRGLIQNVGRGTRIGGETLRVIDYSGFSPILIDGAHRLNPTSDRDRRYVPPTMTGSVALNGDPVFRHELRSLFPETFNFSQRFPDFNYELFLSKDKGAFEPLKALAEKLQVSPFIPLRFRISVSKNLKIVSE